MDIVTNKIEMAGRIAAPAEYSHTVFDEKFYSSVMEIKRLSDCSDIIPITVSERHIDEIREDRYVRISGQLRSYNYYLKVDGLSENRRSKLVVTAFCRSILPFETYMNDVMLDGFVCKKPIYRKTPFGKEITDVLLAVNRSYGKSDYIPVIFWGVNAGVAATLDVGNRIGVTGRIQSREYEKRHPDGSEEKKMTYEVSGFKLEKK